MVFMFFIGSIQSAPEKMENAALFLLLALPSTLIRHEKRNLTLALRFNDKTDNVLKTQILENDVAAIVIPCQDFRQTPKWLMIAVTFLSRRSVEEKLLMSFSSETSVFTFLRRCVEGALDNRPGRPRNFTEIQLLKTIACNQNRTR